ncbi:MAG: hypothetical protein ACLQMF_07060 [Rectinemataceae bacterium]
MALKIAILKNFLPTCPSPFIVRSDSSDSSDVVEFDRFIEIMAAFVSPQDPSMLELSKYAAGLVWNKMKPDIDKNLQFGMGIFEALRFYGLVQGVDPTSPYKKAARRARRDRVRQVPLPDPLLQIRRFRRDSAHGRRGPRVDRHTCGLGPPA